MKFSEHNTMREAPVQSPAEGGVDESHMTLGSGDLTEQEITLTDDKPRLSVNSGALLIVIVAAVAAAGLFSMRTLTRASGAGGTPVEVIQSIDEFLDVVLREGIQANAGRDGVLDVLNESYARRQVPLDAVQRNPFIIFDDAPIQAPVVPGVDPLIAQREARSAELERAGSHLRVGMILMGAQPMANVNNRVVRVGEIVKVDPDVEFRVVAINPNRVEFVAEDRELGVQVERIVNLRRD